MRNIRGILLLAAMSMFAAPAAGHAENLFRFFPELSGTGFYSDNVPVRTNNQIGDFGGILVGGFYLDYTSEARYASLHYDTFVQLFTHQTRFDRAGEGQFVSATDYEKLSATTKLRFDELFYRDAEAVTIITSSEAPAFNTVAVQLLLANDLASVNQFSATLTHDWGQKLASELSVHQTTFWENGSSNNAGFSGTDYYQGLDTITDYHFSSTFSLGAGYRFYDFRFTFPGQPGEEAHWPLAHVLWSPLENVHFAGIVGPVIAHVQGSNEDKVIPAGQGAIEYDFRHGHFNVSGGQEPAFVPGVGGGVGELLGVRGALYYDFTQRVSGNVGGEFYQSQGTKINAQLITWGVGIGDRLNRWLSVSARFIQVRRNDTGSNQFLPTGTQSGREAVGNYFIIGASASIEAFRWSWQ